MGRSRSEILRIGYDALPSQDEFHRCESTFKGFSGPVGSGKSRALCQEAIRLSFLNPGRMGLLGAPTYPMLRAATQLTLFEVLEELTVQFEYNKAENMLVMNDTGSKILFRPVEEVERLRGTNLAWFGIDELTYTPEAAWLRLEARLRDPKAQRLCGFAVWTPKGYDWVYRKFVGENRTKDYQAIFAKPRENKHLAADFYERLKSSYDDNFYRQEVLGEYLSLTAGLVYSSFTKDQNVVEVQPESQSKLFWSLDFNVNPMCSVIAQRSGDTIRVLDEILIRNATTAQACEELLKRFPRHPSGLTIYGDASAHHQQTTGLSDYEMIQGYMAMHSPMSVKYEVPRSNPSVRDRINLTNAKLRSASGNIELLVDPKCKELIMDFEQVCYKEDSNQIEKDRDRQRTHLSDALGYLLWQEFRPARPMGEQGRRLLPW
ncbi:MAG: phage terminase large subunit [Acidobacteriia bacterium]|nr:phage terminase large subunit [Terriglobia bacterium]